MYLRNIKGDLFSNDRKYSDINYEFSFSLTSCIIYTPSTLIHCRLELSKVDMTRQQDKNPIQKKGLVSSFFDTYWVSV